MLFPSTVVPPAGMLRSHCGQCVIIVVYTREPIHRSVFVLGTKKIGVRVGKSAGNHYRKTLGILIQ